MQLPEWSQLVFLNCSRSYVVYTLRLQYYNENSGFTMVTNNTKSSTFIWNKRKLTKRQRFIIFNSTYSAQGRAVNRESLFLFLCDLYKPPLQPIIKMLKFVGQNAKERVENNDPTFLSCIIYIYIYV